MSGRRAAKRAVVALITVGPLYNMLGRGELAAVLVSILPVTAAAEI